MAMWLGDVVAWAPKGTLGVGRPVAASLEVSVAPPEEHHGRRGRPMQPPDLRLAAESRFPSYSADRTGFCRQARTASMLWRWTAS